jgi:signal transduction histidine kinase
VGRSQLAIEAIISFARLVSDDRGSSEILPLLAAALREHATATAVAVLGIDRDGSARIKAAPGLTSDVEARAFDANAIGKELGDEILRLEQGDLVSAQTRPLVAGGNLFGAAVMLFGKGSEPSEEALRLAEGLIDLAAIALANAAQLEQLERSYEDLRTSQDILARTEKLRALGQMAAGVSHDLKNILNPLSLHIQFADRALVRGQQDEVRTSLAEMKGVVTRGVETLEQLRSYSRQTNAAKTELVDLDRVLHEAAGIAKPRMASMGGGRLARIQEQLGKPAPVSAVSGEVVSALVNLIVNAIDALAGAGGTITLRTGEADGGSWVEVEDDGPGMPADVEKRVFEPFFTTKGLEGTGLGLAMVYATVQRHGGKIDLTTSEGHGTRFRLWFPGAPPLTKA